MTYYYLIINKHKKFVGKSKYTNTEFIKNDIINRKQKDTQRKFIIDYWIKQTTDIEIIVIDRPEFIKSNRCYCNRVNSVDIF